MGQRGRDQADQRGDGGIACPGRSAARSPSRSGALLSRGPDCVQRRNRGPGSAKQRFARATRCIAPGTRGQCFKFQTATPSRSRGAKRPRFANPSRTARGMERWEAPGHQWAPLRQAVNPPRAARHRARPRLGAAPPSAPPASSSTIPGRPGPASSRSAR
jgi:hypothetical protein